jgi:plastocyanin
MRRVAVVTGLLAGIAIGVAAAAVGIAGAAPVTAAPAHLFVNAKEFSLVLSRQRLAPGDARIQLYNGGEDAHDLRLKRVGGTRTLSIRATTPGNVTELRTMLRSGTWKLWCSLPGHAAAGMRATLTVRR